MAFSTDRTVRELLLTTLSGASPSLGMVTPNVHPYLLEFETSSKKSKYLTATVSGALGNKKETKAFGVQVTSEDAPYAGAGNNIWIRNYSMVIEGYYPEGQVNNLIDEFSIIRGQMKTELYPTMSGLVDRLDPISNLEITPVEDQIDNKEGVILKGRLEMRATKRNADYEI